MSHAFVCPHSDQTAREILLCGGPCSATRVEHQTGGGTGRVAGPSTR